MTTANKALDPICGMTVSPETAAAHVTHASRDFYFCSKGCAAKFQQDAGRFLTAPGSSPMETNHKKTSLARLGAPPSLTAAKGTAYICPMDPEVRSNRPGACPKCGMALEPEVIAAPATR